ncbi:MAG: sporulation inhibitor of replication protein SirA [Bacilli bacterium]|nr:sporulation inhibitor of replication protein SirA [Bacilli bacterium]
MKVYYIFKIKEEFLSLYRDTPSMLYHILKSIYYLDQDNLEVGYNLFNQLIDTIDKITIDRELFIKMHQDYPYIKKNDIHIINNLYKNEVSRLQITHFFMKLELDQDNSSFYDFLYQKNKDYFICNFNITDFFFLEDYIHPKRLALDS